MGDILRGRRVILDGELIGARDNRLDFWAIGGRWHASESQRSPVAFLAFDVLWVDGERVTHGPLRDRKAILADLNLDGRAWREAPWQVDDGRALLAACEELRLERIVAKRLDSIYRPGARTNPVAEEEVQRMARGAVAAAGANAVKGGQRRTAAGGPAGVPRERERPNDGARLRLTEAHGADEGNRLTRFQSPRPVEQNLVVSRGSSSTRPKATEDC
jgi:bifunctional non-homologous end joining protein LigD